MDIMANRAVLSTVKTEKGLKTKKKIEKASKPIVCVKSPTRVTKKKKSQTKAGNLKLKKDILKETLKNVENDSGKLIEKNKKPHKKVVKNTDSKESKQIVKQKKSKENKEISQENKTEFEETTQKLKKQKKFIQPKEKILIKKQDSSDVTPGLSSFKDIKIAVTTVFKLAKDGIKSDKTLMDDEASPIFLQLCCVKIPKTSTRQLRMTLPHSLVTPDDDVALIVKDLKKGRRKDYEPTIEHFEELLKEHKCDRIKTIIPMNQIKTEYDQYELKRNLVFSHDYFLIDGKISGHAARMLGKIFSKKRKLPTSVRMGSKDLKHEIDHALSKTSMQLNSKGDTHIVQIGTTVMKKEEIAKNIQAVCKSLAVNYPGGWENIRSLRIKTSNSLGIPIYMTMKSRNEVDAPEVKPKRPKAYRTLEGELTTVDEDAIVTVTPEGTVSLNVEIDSEDESKDAKKRKKSKMDSIDQEEEEDED